MFYKKGLQYCNQILDICASLSRHGRIIFIYTINITSYSLIDRQTAATTSDIVSRQKYNRLHMLHTSAIEQRKNAAEYMYKCVYSERERER